MNDISTTAEHINASVATYVEKKGERSAIARLLCEEVSDSYIMFGKCGQKDCCSIAGFMCSRSFI